MEQTHFELVFCRNDGDVAKIIRVCIELDHEDQQLLNGGENLALMISDGRPECRAPRPSNMRRY